MKICSRPVVVDSRFVAMRMIELQFVLGPVKCATLAYVSVHNCSNHKFYRSNR